MGNNGENIRMCMVSIKTLALFLLLTLNTTMVFSQKDSYNIRGTVKDNKGEIIIGAAVIVKGTVNGVQTDVNGKFDLSVSKLPVEISVSYIGHSPFIFKVDNTNINEKRKVVLKAETENLDQIMVVAYGSTSKRSFTGSASSLSSKELTELPVSDVSQALQGRVAGVQVGNSSGQPGSGMSIRIRGTGSINSSREPLYVIDGIPVVSGDLSGTKTMSTNVMSSINPDDIANITVLKDAAASSLYGSRAANGVILITTKKGRNAKTRFKLKTEYGISDFAMPLVQRVNGDTERKIKREGLINYYVDHGSDKKDAENYVDGKTTAIKGLSLKDTPRLNDIAPIPQNGYSDWNKELFRQGINKSIDFSASGGDDKTNFFTSLSYLKQNGLVEKSDFDRISGRLNLNHKVNDKLSFGINTTLSMSEQNGILDATSYFTNPVYGMNVFLSPTLAIRNNKGAYNTNIPNGYPNIVKEQHLENINKTLTKRSLSSLYASYNIMPGLNFKTTLGVDLIFTDFTRFNTIESDAEDSRGLNGRTEMSNRVWKTITSSNIFNYNKTFNKLHSISLLVGYEVEYTLDKTSSMVGTNFPNNKLYNLSNSGKINSGNSLERERGLISYLSRLNYVYNDKYYFSASYRSDASSILSDGNRFGNFWSLSASWDISKESFLSSIPWINDWRIRASYGTNGTLPGNWYASQGLYSYGNNYNGQIGNVYKSIANPNLSWEQNLSTNIGTNIKLFNSLSVDFDIFNKKTKDLIVSVPISHTTGFTSTLKNYGNMTNKGWELGITSDNFARKDFQWTTSIEMGQVRNKITKLYADVIPWPSFHIYKEGHSINSIYLREYAGANPANGHAQWWTNKKDDKGNIISRKKTEDYNEANPVIVGSSDPDLEGNITNTFKYKGVDFSAMFNYRIGGYTYDMTAATPSRPGVNHSDNDGETYWTPIRKSGEHRWQKQGDITNVPRYVYNNDTQSGYPSSRFMHSADFLRLKSVTLGYTLPNRISSKANIDRCRFYFTGMNLLTWAKSDIYDPEVDISGLNNWGLPPVKTYTVGVQLDF